MRDVVATEYHLARIGMLKTGSEAQERCFTAATGAKEREKLRWIYGQAQLSKNRLPVKTLGDALKLKNRGHVRMLRIPREPFGLRFASPRRGPEP
jgi:hypothetical protein